MPVKQQWFIEDRVVYVRYWGDVSAEEIGQAYSDSLSFVRASKDPRQVHFLHDWTDWHTFPKNIMQIRKHIDVNLTAKDRQKIGWMVVYGNNNRLLSYLGRVIMQIARVSFRIYHEQDKAISYLKSMDISLKDYDFSDLDSKTDDQDESQED
jgi:hypothetical protein